MGRTLINNRRDTINSIGSLTIFAVTICALSISTGCSKIGSQRALDHSRLPFNNPSATTQANIRNTQQLADQSQQRRRDRLTNQAPNNPVRDKSSDVKTVQNRPPKLSVMPKLTLYAEPIVTKASQVSFEQDANFDEENSSNSALTAFDPTAEPPAQIFAQPVQATELAPPPQAPAARIASSRTLTPMLFDSSTRQVKGSFAGSLRDSQLVEPSPKRLTLNSEPLIVVDDRSSAPQATDEESPEETAITKADILEYSRSVANPTFTPTADNNVSALTASNLSSVSPFPLLPGMQSMNNRTTAPVVSSDAFAANDRSTTLAPTHVRVETAGPVVDTDFIGRSSDLRPIERRAVVESDVHLAADISDANDLSEIEIDANLSRGYHVFTLSPTPVELPKAEIDQSVVEPVVTTVQPLPPPLPTNLELPILDPPTENALFEKLPKVELNQVAESDFAPLPQQAKRCPNCNHENCADCGLPETPLFAGNIPNFDPGRNVGPMPVTVASLPSAELIKKNFANVTFSPTDLPLPTDGIASQDVNASFDTSADQFMAVGFDDAPREQQVTQTDVAPIGVETLMKLNAVTWRSRLAQTVDLVQEQLNQHDIDSATRTSLEVNLRLLDVLSRQMGDLVENQKQFSTSENQYWQDQLEAITSMLKIANPKDARANELLRHHTAHETLSHLRNAVAHLESLANLRVVAGEFCTEVSGYGQFKLFNHNVFPVGQKVLVYCEIENFNSYPQDSQTGVNYLTRLRGSYAIYDSSGRAVQQAEFPTLEDTARKRGRDFYMHLPITVGNLSPGNYELHLLVEDLGGNKTASLTPPLLFSVEAELEEPIARQARR